MQTDRKATNVQCHNAFAMFCVGVFVGAMIAVPGTLAWIGIEGWRPTLSWSIPGAVLYAGLLLCVVMFIMAVAQGIIFRPLWEENQRVIAELQSQIDK